MNYGIDIWDVGKTSFDCNSFRLRSTPGFLIFEFLLMKKSCQSSQITHKDERHLLQSKKEDDDDEDDDKGSSKEQGKAKIIRKLKMSLPAINF